MDTATRSLGLDRRAARRSRTPVVIAADEASLGELEAVLATLPLCAAGRVFIEVPGAEAIVALEAPRRMSITWLDRSTRSGDPGTSQACPRGRALVRAVTAWADEMLCEGADPTRVILLGGYLATAEIHEHLVERRGVPAASVHTPPAYGLSAPR